MSLDTVTRINTYFEDQITNGQNVTTIFEDKNEGLFEPADSPFVKVWVEPSVTTPLGVGPVPEDYVCYGEEGIVIIQIFAVTGLGSKDLYSTFRIASLIVDAFAGIELLPTGSESGIIKLKKVTQRQVISIRRSLRGQGRGSTFDGDWKRKDLFITYNKYY